MGKFPDYGHYDALGLAELVRNGEVSAGELLSEAQARLNNINHRLNAVCYQTDHLSASLIKGLNKHQLFCGVPFLVKDLMLPFKDMPLSNGSRAMKSYIPTENSRMADCINSSGLITFGKTTTSELGASSLTRTVAFGDTLNPWDSTKNAGGSSGGSSVVVACRVVPMAYSSDGGGSIRLPASYCGIFGLKPSRSLNKYEDMSEAWGGAVVSHVSTVSVRDSAAYLDLVTGKTNDDYNVRNPPKDSYLYSATHYERTLKIGLITTPPTLTDIHPECIKAAEFAASACETLGHHVEHARWNLDGRELMRSFLTVVMHYTYRDVTTLARLLNAQINNLDIELNTRFMAIIGGGVNKQRLEKALRIWIIASEKMQSLHDKFDVILTPTVATPPLESDALDASNTEKLLMKLLIKTGLGKKVLNKRFLEMLIDKSLYQTPFTPIANITGQPAMSIPLHWDSNGIPHGAHFMAAIGNDQILFMLAQQLEKTNPWRHQIPGVSNT